MLTTVTCVLAYNCNNNIGFVATAMTLEKLVKFKVIDTVTVGVTLVTHTHSHSVSVAVAVALVLYYC